MVPLTNITIGGNEVTYDFNQLNENGGKAFIDSGTTFVYFDSHLFKAFTH